MNTKIDITGVIGIDTPYDSIAKKLDSSSGNLEIVINSVGGYVYDGIAIYNAIKKYNRGEKTIKVSGLSASIASYIMLASDRLILEENSVVMIHNPSIAVMGDHRKLKNACSHIEKLRNLMSKTYSKHTGIEKTEVEEMMDSETFFIGKDELKIWGEVVEGTDETKTTKAEAEIQIKGMVSLIKKESEKNSEKLVAMLDELLPEENEKFSIFNSHFSIPPKVDNINNKPKEIQMEKEKLENLNDLKTQYPKLYAEAVNIGIEQEKSRVKAHLEFMDVAPEIAINSIKENVQFLNNSEIQAKYIKARINRDEIATMEKENNPNLIPKKIDEGQELKAEQERENLEAEAKIKSFMPHLNTKPNNQ